MFEKSIEDIKYKMQTKEIEYAIECINNYYFEEFNIEPDLRLNEEREINLAYTEDEMGIPKQITTIIGEKEFYVYEDKIKVRTIKREKTNYLKELEFMDFDWLINF